MAYTSISRTTKSGNACSGGCSGCKIDLHNKNI
ncbi:MAG: hypothetical protein K8S00_12900 [Bacteroidales bacterium]|nr:hypothetical protein [Bacteroidales bacterium]